MQTSLLKITAVFILSVFGTLSSNAYAEPDEELLGKSQGYPVGTASNWFLNPYRVGSWSAFHTVPGLQMRPVSRAAKVKPLPTAAISAAIRYRYKNLDYTLTDYLERQRATGLLILKNGEIVAEHYQYGRKEDARFLSFSMAKSVTALLIGAALERGHITSLDDPAEKYAKAIAGSPYGATTIRQLLRMSSGLTFTERYDGKDDFARFFRASNVPRSGVTPTDFLRSATDRHSPAGQKFVYATVETDVLSRVLTAATGKNMADLTRDWLWQPIGAEHDAYWRLSLDGQEQGWGAFVASLRDWGRLGLLLANDGKAGGQQVISQEYLLDATDPSRQPEPFKPRKASAYSGYGYQFWLLPMKERTFAMYGVHGQTVYVQPSSGVVVVITSAWEQAGFALDPLPSEERDAFWRGVLRSLGGNTTE